MVTQQQQQQQQIHLGTLWHRKIFKMLAPFKSGLF